MMQSSAPLARRRFAVLPARIAREEILGYTISIFASLFMLLAVAISIDLAKNFDEVMALRVASAGGSIIFEASRHLLWYLGLRIVDMMTRLMPFAVFGGVLGFELWSLFSRRRAIHWASGRHPLQLLAGVIWVGIAFGSLQYFLDAIARPAAVMQQASERLGAYGRRFERQVTIERRWIVAGNQVIEARIRFQPTPALLEPDIYDLDATGRLKSVIRARLGEPIDGGYTWKLKDAATWQLGNETPPMTPFVASEATIKLEIGAIDLAYSKIPAKYVPQEHLSTLLRQQQESATRGERAVWFHVRRANAVLPGLLALLAVSASLVVGAYRPTGAAMLALAAIGYGAHAVIKALITMGELGMLTAKTTAWAPPAVILIISVGLLGIGLRRN